MRAIVLDRPGRLRQLDVPNPALPQDGVILKTRCVSICSTDISYFHGNLFPDEYPVILGHEYVGEVVDVGQDCQGVQCGDRIVYFGQTDFGGLADYRAIRPIFPGQQKVASFATSRHFADDERAAAVVLPQEIPDTSATMLEPITAVLRSILMHSPKIGEHVLILGAGPCGLIAGSIMRLFYGVKSITILDVNAGRLKHAVSFADNATTTLTNAGDDKIMFDYVFDALPPLSDNFGEDSPRRLAKRLMKSGGRYVLYGASQTLQTFDTWLILAKGLTICAAPFDVDVFPMHKTADVMRSALAYLRTTALNPLFLVSRILESQRIDELNDVFRTYAQTPDLKTIVRFAS